MKADMKKMTDLSQQIEQYEAHVAGIRRDIQTQNQKRDEARAEVELATKEAQSIRAEAEKHRISVEKDLAQEKSKLEVLSRQIAEQKEKLRQEQAASIQSRDAVEMSRRDLENEKRKIAGFMQIINQAVTAWR